MTNLAQAYAQDNFGSFPDATGGAVPAPSRRGTRFPMLFLIDTSGSTGWDPQTGEGGPDADIHRINTAVQGVFQNLRYPVDGTDLAAEQENIDVSLITYNDSLRVELPWTMATQIDPKLAPFKANGGTKTGGALKYALAYIGHRLRYYTSNNIKHGRPTLLHFTDGAPTDMSPGDTAWNAVQASLHRINGHLDPEKRYAVIRHMISANGVDPIRAQNNMAGGMVGTGLQMLSDLSGPKSTLALEDHPDVVGELVEFMTMFMEGVTNIFGSDEPDFDVITHEATEQLNHIKQAC